MIYRITFLHNSEYCHLKPSDPTCHFNVDIEEETKTQAIIKYHQQDGMLWCHGDKSILPQVYEIKEL